MIQTLPCKRILRDRLGRMFRKKDIAIYFPTRKVPYQIVEILDTTKQRVRFQSLTSDKKGTASPSNLLIITHQIEQNIIDNVGVNIPYEERREQHGIRPETSRQDL